MEKRIFKYNKAFKLECGSTLPQLEICYHISKEFTNKKQLNENRPVIWITHALTANSDPSDWWSVLVGKDKFFNPDKYTIICANVLGSCYGTTGANSRNPNTNRPYMLDFPKITVRDVVNCHELLRNELNIEEIELLIGGSVGGFQALEWSIINPPIIKNLVLLATCAKTTPWASAINETQRMILYADQSFEQQEYSETEADEEKVTYNFHGGKKGLSAARALALLTYRSYQAYNISQQDNENKNTFEHKSQSYQRYQGEKLVTRFDPYSYLSMLNLHDSHNIGRDRDCIESALAKITAKTLCIGIESDNLFPPDEQQQIAQKIKNGTFTLIDSFYGHDGFLLEWQKIESAIKDKICKY